MRRHVISLVSLFAFLPSHALLAQESDAARACVAIYKNSTRDYSASQQDSVELARTFSSFCKRDGSVNSSATSVGLGAVIYSIPVSFTFSGSTNEQKITEFCKVGASQYDSWNSGSWSNNTVVTAALDSFNACVASATTGLQLKVAITQPDTLTVTGVPTANYAGFVSTVAYDQSLMTCESADFTPRNTPTIYHGAVHLSAKKTFSVVCTKKKQIASDGRSTYYPRTNLTIAAGSVAPLSIAFPSDTRNGYELASQSKMAVDKAVSELEITKVEGEAAKQRAIALQTSLDSVRVYTRLNGEGAAFGCYDHFANAWNTLKQETCPAGTAKVIGETVEGNVGGKACGYNAHAYACVTLPKP